MGKRERIKNTETQRDFSGVSLHEDTKHIASVFHPKSYFNLNGLRSCSNGKESACNVRDLGSIPGS